jgi:hypothetical protein
MQNQCLQDEGVDCSSGCIRAFVWDFEGSQSLKFPILYYTNGYFTPPQCQGNEGTTGLGV